MIVYLPFYVDPSCALCMCVVFYFKLDRRNPFDRSFCCTPCISLSPFLLKSLRVCVAVCFVYILLSSSILFSFVLFIVFESAPAVDSVLRFLP